VTDRERRRRVEDLCDAALNHAPEERSAFVAAACGSDEALRRDVDALLAHAQTAERFLATPIDAVAAHALGEIPAPSLAGRRFGSYQIVSLVGTGGMGEVYRARDLKLGRDVAIKILPSRFTNDPDRQARFEREARLLAALNHPHIGAIYGLEEDAGVHALVLEFVEGETLAERLMSVASGIGRSSPGLSLEDALTIARQIADALEAAHEKGIVHRDLKPANIQITRDGVVKVLDFGVAKLQPEGTNGAQGELSRGPTIAVDPTRGGLILGTAAYMSPEQARGHTVDARTDIWAFGCVLYEMLTRHPAFGGETISDTIVTILDREPDWAALPETTPDAVRRLVQHCLQKDPKRRLRHVADARMEIDDALQASAINATRSHSAKVTSSGTRPAPWRRSWERATVVAALVLTGVALWAPWRKVPPPASSPPLRLSADLGADVTLATDQGLAAVLSPDGTAIAFVARKFGGGSSQLYYRRLEQLQASAIPGTAEARSPFFSPDGRWVAFFANGKLKKVPATGGAAVTLCDAQTGATGISGGGTWADDGTITFSPNLNSGTTLWRVSSAGGTPERATTFVEGETIHRWPQVLPGSNAVLYTSQAGRFDSANIVVQQLPNGPRKVLLRGGYAYARYVPSGHLVYMHDDTLFAAPFDLDRLEMTGNPVPALEGVATNSAVAAQFASSANGTLAYVPQVSDDATISWMDRAGKVSPLRTTPANWSNPFFAPDGRRLGIDIFDGRQIDVWTYDWARDSLTRLTSDPSDDREPVWTPDGNRIVFASTRDAKSAFNLYWQRVDGTGDAQRLTESKNSQYPASWHPSGRFLVFVEANPQTSTDLMVLPIEGSEASGWKPGEPKGFLTTPATETYPMFSPDGRWLAYASDESGGNEVWVRPFPGQGTKWQISRGGAGIGTLWSRTRNELFYMTPGQQIMVVSYAVDHDVFLADQPQLWSDARFMRRPRQMSIALHPDGARFAVAAAAGAEAAANQGKLVFVFNFFDELRRIAPVQRN